LLYINKCFTFSLYFIISPVPDEYRLCDHFEIHIDIPSIFSFTYSVNLKRRVLDKIVYEVDTGSIVR
jgi:hypothetical protein